MHWPRQGVCAASAALLVLAAIATARSTAHSPHTLANPNLHHQQPANNSSSAPPPPNTFALTLHLSQHAVAHTDLHTLTSVTIDVCAFKSGLNVSQNSQPLLRTLAKHLGGGGAYLRIGGSDQNSWQYNLTSHAPQASCGCGHHGCVLTAAGWEMLVEFAEAIEHRLVFGLAPDPEAAAALVNYTAAHGLAGNIAAFSFGNEIDSSSLYGGYAGLRRLLDAQFPTQRPLLIGPDVALMRHAPLAVALAGQDPTILAQLRWVDEFTANVSGWLDVVSFHTYDFHANELGGSDHHPFVPAAANSSLFWDTRYLDMAARLLGNVSTLARRNTPAGTPVWLSETNSICHQGVPNATNAYLNSLWLVSRVGMMASQGLSVMARQTLVGYDYALLSAWPAEPIRPNPDYFTTLLIRQLLGRAVLSADLSGGGQQQPTRAEDRNTGGDRARAFVFCHASEADAITVLAMNFDRAAEAVIAVHGLPAGAARTDFRLTPVAAAGNPFPFTSRIMALNGQPLAVSAEGDLPPLTGAAAVASQPISLPPSTFAFVVYTRVSVPACSG